VLTKVWPVVLAPVFLLTGRRSAARWFLGSLALALLAWIGWSGWRGPMQVLTLRGARGWEVESLGGALWWVVSGAHPHLEAGAARVGVVPPVANVLLGCGALILLSLAWEWARDRRTEAPGSPAVEGLAPFAAVAALLLAAPILSPQYLIWLLPVAAIAVTRGERRLFAPVMTATILTTAIWLVPFERAHAVQAVILGRNAALMAAAGLAFWRLWMGSKKERLLAAKADQARPSRSVDGMDPALGAQLLVDPREMGGDRPLANPQT